MAFTSGFFNSVNHDRKYDAVQMGQIFDGIIKDGIYATYLSAMVVKESANASEVIVQPGRAWFNHVWAYNDADYPMAAPDPEVVLDRIDTLVLDVNSEDAVREAKYMWVQGTPTSQIPEPPELIHTVTHNQYPLADVYRQAGTTQIYAADITNRVGTSDCPFVTGIIETINIDSLLTQWDAEFHTWEAATKNAFEGWMLNQEGAYTLWWNSMKSQMEDDVEELEAWIATIHDILDEEVATRLQAEIDEIKTQLPTGSYIKVTTTDTELFNRTVTITDEDNNTVTSTFNASGVAIFKTVPYVGYLTIESTDGIRVATNTVETPYFARYAFNLAFWSATVNISADTELGGETCVVKNSEAIVVTSIVLNAEGEGVFNATYPDTYTFSVTHGGETMEVSLAVTQETTYSVEIHGGFNWRGWLDASVDLDSSDYTDLDDVLSDEKAIRELFLVHDCVDYLAAVSTANTDVETILNNDLCAKWINNSDYALDTLSANAALKTVMDEADKYGYGEWCLMPQVPTMTSNTAPYGEAGASSISATSNDAYKAFDGNDSSEWAPSGTSGGEKVYYHFTKPIVPKMVTITVPSSHASRITKGTIIGSNDGSTWTPLGETATIGTSLTIELDNDTAYSYVGLECTTVTDRPYIGELQFYAYAPKGAVPKMTSNTAPYGEAGGTNKYSKDYYYAFNGDDSNNVSFNKNITCRLWYKFTNPINPKGLTIWDNGGTANPNINSYKVIGSNDGTNWTDIETFADDIRTKRTNTFDCDDYYLYVGVEFTPGASGAYIATLQFYGRQLSVSVPVMTSNTAPFGEVIESEPSVGSASAAYKVFANLSFGDHWSLLNSSASHFRYIGYHFTEKVCIKQIVYRAGYQATKPSMTFDFEGSNDGVIWNPIKSNIQTPSTDSEWLYEEVDNDAYYEYYRISSSDYNNYYNGTYRWTISDLQFYGLDYSEKEFEAGTNKKWLYDHGVELVPFSTTGNAQKEDGQLHVKGVSALADAYTTNMLDLTPYDLLRAKCGNVFSTTYSNICGDLKVTRSNPSSANMQNIASYTFTTPFASPNNLAIDISSVDQEAYIVEAADTSSYTYENSLTELWVE